MSAAPTRRGREPARPDPALRAAALAENRPPAEIAWLVEAVGAANALTLIETYGGEPLKIPVKQLNQGSPLARLIGLEAARRLATWREATLTRDGNGSVHVYIPLVKWWRIRVYHAEGLRQAEIARRLGVSLSCVQRHLMLAGRTNRPAQLDLFPPA